MGRHVLHFGEIDRTMADTVGGKGAHLAELARLDGVRVPPGFCVTTDAFRRAVADTPAIADAIDALARLAPDDRAAIGAHAAALRATVEQAAIPDDVASEIARALATLGPRTPCAVRSSATGEDSAAT